MDKNYTSAQGARLRKYLQDLAKAIQASLDEPLFKRYEQLRNTAEVNGLKVEDQGGDGDCQFRAVSHQLAVHTGQQVQPAELRKQAVTFLHDNPHLVSNQNQYVHIMILTLYIFTT